MRYTELPNLHRLFSDWLQDAPTVREFLPVRPDLPTIKEQAAALKDRQFQRVEIHRLLAAQAVEQGAHEPARRNIERLLQPGCTVVLASAPAAFAAGPLALLLKCLTATKVAAVLERAGIPSIPVCWLNPDPGSFGDSLSINVLGRAGELSRVELRSPVAGNGSRAGDWPIPEEVVACFSLMESSLGLQPDDQILEELKKAFAPGTPYRRACARFIAALLRDWGVVVLDPLAEDFRTLSLRTLEGNGFSFDQATILFSRQEERLDEAGYACPAGGKGTHSGEYPAADATCSAEGSSRGFPSGPFAQLFLEAMLPVAAHVIDQREICSFALVVPVLKKLGLAPPGIWPRATATVLDARSRKIMEKYGIGLSDLFSDRAQLLRDLTREAHAGQVISRLESLGLMLDRTIEEVRAALGPGNSLGELPMETRSKMRFQLERLRKKYAAATSLRREAIERQVERVCASLAPDGRLQEEVIAGLHFVMRNSSDFLSRLNDALNIESFTHQLIPVE